MLFESILQKSLKAFVLSFLSLFLLESLMLTPGEAMLDDAPRSTAVKRKGRAAEALQKNIGTRQKEKIVGKTQKESLEPPQPAHTNIPTPSSAVTEEEVVIATVLPIEFEENFVPTAHVVGALAFIITPEQPETTSNSNVAKEVDKEEGTQKIN